MRNRRRRYSRKSGALAGKWFLVCCVVLAMVVAVKVLAPDIKNKVQSVMSPVYERTEQYKTVFTQFGEALSGDHSFTDVFSSVINLGKRS